MSVITNQRIAKMWLLTYPQCSIPKEDILEQIKRIQERKGKPIKFIVVSEEEHHQTEGVHRHVFMVLEDRMSLRRNQMRDYDIVDSSGMVFHPNLERCNSPNAAYKYVIKDGKFIEWGTRPNIAIKLSVKDRNNLLLNGDLTELVENGQLSIFQTRLLFQCKEILRLERQRKQEIEKPIVHYYFGKTGTGKTWAAFEEAKWKWGDENVWFNHKTDDWFDGYRGQDAVILDDIRSNTWRFEFLLRLLDRYYLEVPIKGGHARWIPREIWITAPGEPRDIYKNHSTGESYDDIDQLERRIDDCKCFEVRGAEPVNCHLAGMTSNWFSD